MRNGQKRLLFLSLVILAALTLIFLGKDFVDKSSEGEKESAYVVEMGTALGNFGRGFVSVVKNCAQKVSSWFVKTASNIKTFFSNLSSRDEKNNIVEDTPPSPNIEFDFADSGEMLEESDDGGNVKKVIDDSMTIVTNSSGVRYLAFTPGSDLSGIDIVRYLIIPAESFGISFRPMQDLVYASSDTNLYLDAKLQTTSVYPVYVGKSFTRTGISSNGIYQLVDSNKQIVYADGSAFSRLKEDKDYDEKVELPQKRLELELKLFLQNPELPNGCEITSLAMVLDYLGYKVDKCILADDYLPKGPYGKANFYEEYIGNPRDKDGLGCYAPVIVDAANKFLQSRSSSYCARDYTGTDFYEVINQLEAGNPSIVWISSYMDVEPRLTTKWMIDGESLVWKSNLHCVVVSGYDGQKGTIITYDPLYGITEYDLDLFVKRFKQYYSQVVILGYK